MEDFKYCRVCLATDVKMYSFHTCLNIPIGAIYTQLIQIPVYEDNQHACYECTRMLHKYHKFKLKCARAHSVLSAIRDDKTRITKQDIQSIDRKHSKLESDLRLSSSATYHEFPNNLENIFIEMKKEDKFNIEELILKNNEASELVGTDGDETLNEVATDTLDSVDTILSTAQLKCKIKTAKEPKTKKRKIKSTELIEDLSDDEPLTKFVTNKAIIKKYAESKQRKVRTSRTIDDKIIINAPEKSVKSRKTNGFNVSEFDDYATVVFLTPEDARQEVLLRKESSNYKKSPFKCDKCYRGYEAKAAFENHMKKHSIEYGDYECDVCYLRFPQQIYLCKHRLSCHKRKFSCKLCPYVCYCTYQAKTHVSLHKGKKYPCKDCGEIFSMPNSLLMHKRMKHLNEAVRESVCEHCGQTFGTPRGLFLHNMKVHRQDKNEKHGPQCDECGVHFASEVAWKRHLVLSTKHKVSNGCKCCGDTFASAEELKAHMRAHSRKHTNRWNSIKLPAPCSYCDKWLTSRAEFKAHVTSEHPHCDDAKKLTAEQLTPFVCEVCGQMFKQRCFLRYHQRKHSGERPYACAQCAKRFPLASALAVHRGVHARRRAHQCHLCARRFAFKGALNKHLKVHLGIRPHKCAICDKGFIHMCDLRLHIKYVHDKVPWPKKKPKRSLEENPTFMEYS